MWSDLPWPGKSIATNSKPSCHTHINVGRHVVSCYVMSELRTVCDVSCLHDEPTTLIQVDTSYS